MPKVLVNVNGHIAPPEKQSISPLDRSFLFGDGVYETGRSLKKTFVFFEDHMERLRRSAAKVSLTLPWTNEFIFNELCKTAIQFGKEDSYFRFIVSRGTIDEVSLSAPAQHPTYVIVLQDLPTHQGLLRSQGISLMTSSIRRNHPKALDPAIKANNHLNCILALQEAKTHGFDDAALLNQEGYLAEGTTFSIFAANAGSKEVFTPSLQVGILDSLTRRHLIALAKERFNIHEVALSDEEFKACEEVWISSSIREVVSVRRWDKTSYSVPGKVAGEIYRLFQDHVASHIQTSPYKYAI